MESADSAPSRRKEAFPAVLGRPGSHPEARHWAESGPSQEPQTPLRLRLQHRGIHKSGAAVTALPDRSGGSGVRGRGQRRERKRVGRDRTGSRDPRTSLPAPPTHPSLRQRGPRPTLTVSQAPAAARPHSPLRAALPLPAPASARGGPAPSRDAAVVDPGSTRPRGLAALAPDSKALGDHPAPLRRVPQPWRLPLGDPSGRPRSRPAARRIAMHGGSRGRTDARSGLAGRWEPKGGARATAGLRPLRRRGPAVPADPFPRAERTGIVSGPRRALETTEARAPRFGKAGATPPA